MKTTAFLFGLLCFLSPAPLFAEDADTEADAPFRIWKNSEGKQLKARLLSVEDDAITIKTDRGRVYRDVKLELFSEDDHAWVKAYQEEQAAKEAEALNRPRTQPLLVTAGELLFEEKFEAASEGWRKAHGSWEMEGGVLTAQEREEDNHGAVMKRAMPIKNAVIEFEVKLSETAKHASFGFDDTDHICRFQITPKAFMVKKDDHDHEGPDKGVLLEKKDVEANPEEWSMVRLELVGTHFLAEVNEETAYGSHDLIASEKAKWGFVVGGGPVQFRGFRLWTAEAAPDQEKALEKLNEDRQEP